MRVTEEMISGIVKAIKGSYKVVIHKEGNQNLTNTDEDNKKK